MASVPIYGSALSLGLARNRIEEAGMLSRTDLIPVADGERRKIGPFDCQFIPVTHSVPHGFATAIFTPAGTILHSGDFKLDQNPVDGRMTDLALIGEIGRRGVRLLLSDSTNAEEAGHTPSESTVGVVLRELFWEHSEKRIIAACFASHIHRVQQIAEVAIESGRQIAFLGPVHAAERPPGPVDGAPQPPRRPHHRHRRDRPLRAEPDLRDLHRLPG